MSPAEIIALDCMKRHINPEKVMNSMSHHMGKGSKMLHDSETVLFMMPIAQGVYDTHLFTHDNPLTLSKVLMGFIQDFKQMGVHRLYGNADNMGIVHLLKTLAERAGLRMAPSDQPKYNWMIDL